MDEFVTPVNLEVQWASERVIAAVERTGGTITTAFYDMASLQAMADPEKFFKRGEDRVCVGGGLVWCLIRWNR